MVLTITTKRHRFMKITNWQLHSATKTRPKEGGGVAIFVKHNLIFSPCSVAVEKDIEAVGVKLQTNNSKLTVIGINKSLNGNKEVFFSNLQNVLTDLAHHNQKFILMGDFNFDTLTPNSPSTKCFVYILRLFGLELSVNSPMRVTSTSQTATY